MKRHGWVDDDSEESDSDHPTTYLDAIRRLAKPATTFPPHAQSRPVMIRGRGREDAG